jgi:hypothetical protein
VINSNSPFLRIKLKEKTCRTDQQGLDLTLVLLLSHHVKRKILELEWLGFSAGFQAMKNTSAPNVAGAAHGVVRHIHTLVRVTLALQMRTHLI